MPHAPTALAARPRPRARPRRAWLALAGWLLLTLGAPAAIGGPLRATPSDDASGPVWVCADAVAPAALAPRDPRCIDLTVPPVHRLSLPQISPAIDATIAARAADRVEVPADHDVARWCLARATSTALT